MNKIMKPQIRGFMVHTLKFMKITSKCWAGEMGWFASLAEEIRVESNSFSKATQSSL